MQRDWVASWKCDPLEATTITTLLWDMQWVPGKVKYQIPFWIWKKRKVMKQMCWVLTRTRLHFEIEMRWSCCSQILITNASIRSILLMRIISLLACCTEDSCADCDASILSSKIELLQPDPNKCLHSDSNCWRGYISSCCFAVTEDALDSGQILRSTEQRPEQNKIMDRLPTANFSGSVRVRLRNFAWSNKLILTKKGN